MIFYFILAENEQNKKKTKLRVVVWVRFGNAGFAAARTEIPPTLIFSYAHW